MEEPFETPQAIVESVLPKRKITKILTPEESAHLTCWPERKLEDSNAVTVHEDSQKHNRWAEAVGIRYAEPFDISRLRTDHQACAQKVLQWAENPTKGLRVVGPTGSGKTRSVSLALKTLSYAGKSIYRINGIRFAMKASHAFKDVDGADSFFDKIVKHDVVFIDDFAKRILEGSFVTSALAIHEILEEMWEREKLVILTTNLTRQQIKETLFKDHQHLAESLDRRLGPDYMDAIRFEE